MRQVLSAPIPAIGAASVVRPSAAGLSGRGVFLVASGALTRQFADRQPR